MTADNFELLVEFTKDDDPRSRAMAVAGLAKLADPRGFAPVIVCLFDPVDEVRATAATALGVFADDRAFEALVEGLADPCQQVGVNSAWALGQILSSRCFDKLIEILMNAQYADAVQVAAATALGERAAIAGSDLATSDALIERCRVCMLNCLQAENSELRAASVWTLGHLPKDKQTVYACIDALEDDYEWVVRYAIEALAQFGDAAAQEQIAELADSDNEAIAALAQQALTKLR